MAGVIRDTGLEGLIRDSLDAREKKNRTRRKAFVTFIKEILKHDKRYNIVPYEDSRKRTLWVSPSGPDTQSILGSVMLKREGTYADVVIHANEPRYGIVVNAGSNFSRGGIEAYPSPSLAWSMVAMANELERQFTREVEWEMNKHNQTILKKVYKQYKKRG